MGKRSVNRAFSKQEGKMARKKKKKKNPHMKKFSISLAVKEIIKITLISATLLLGWLSSRKKTATNVGSSEGMGMGEGDPHHCWWKCKLVQPLWKTVWRLFKKVKIKLPYDPAIASLGYIQRNASKIQ
jgi:hypothetical protein